MSRHSIVFLSILGAMVGAHVVVFVCLLKAVGRVRFLTRGLLLIMFVLIPFTFPTAWVWHHLRPGIGPGILHMCTSVWLGFVLNFLMCLGLALVFAGIVRLMKRGCGAKMLMRCTFGIAAGVTLFGIVNAKFPRVKEVIVEIRDLPGQWQERTIVQLSDVHLGRVHGNGFLRRVAKRVDRLQPDLVLITGDLFDGLVVDCGAYVESLKLLRGRQGVFFVTGNHEGYLGMDKALAALARTHIRVLNDEVVEIEGLQILGAGYPLYRGERRMPFADGSGYRRDLPAILMYHTPTGLGRDYEDMRSQQMSTYFSPRVDFGRAREMGIDLQLSGHTHGGQTFPFNLVTRALFDGFHRGLHRLGDFSIYISAGTGTWGPPMRLGQSSEITLIRLVPAR